MEMPGKSLLRLSLPPASPIAANGNMVRAGSNSSYGSNASSSGSSGGGSNGGVSSIKTYISVYNGESVGEKKDKHSN